ncbi:MAG TPA: YafY family protein [Thermomicrobiales bacterium]
MVYRPTARVLTVLELLQVYGRLTGAALAARLEVDIRTVRQYIETLRDLGIPVEAERGRYGAYRLRPGYKLPPLIFNEDEALALTLSLLLARRSGLATTAPAVEGALAKIERVLPEATRARVRAVQETVVFAEGTFQAAPPTVALTVLSEAVQTGHSVQLRYAASGGRETERAFDPYGVVSNWGSWYTIGHCHLRGGERLFRLDRIKSIVALDTPYLRPAAFDALTAVQEALAAVPRVWRVEVWLGATIAEAQRYSGMPRAYFTEVADGCVLRTNVEELGEMARYLAGFECPLAIRQPAELRDVLRRHALRLARDARRGIVRRLGSIEQDKAQPKIDQQALVTEEISP